MSQLIQTHSTVAHHKHTAVAELIFLLKKIGLTQFSLIIIIIVSLSLAGKWNDEKIRS